ncbi:mechanosensitive ion channel family protein [Asticcacaulis sp. EMRT-3]|uniref:mechanosensitive ion channel family protein n=1 Tax=Asticcacaulis sp. EMRT-3 TaxID=3040349 RepID=UPI0024AEA545|nr:mechanosensitive ion channel family protein [Asticcacaulis sp. EMRT-3]MDI7774924.1 mechanosensitive ion channel family protein [Asticcacaulis sp. EMRT-3]
MNGFDFSSLKTFFTRLGGLIQHYGQHLAAKPDFFANLGWAAVILLVTFIISGMLSDAVKRTARRLVQKDGDRTLLEFFSQVVRWLVLIVGLVACLKKLGVETASLITILGAASLAIGLALQSTLSNVASGLMILFNKPYRIGDMVRIGDVQGVVHRLGIFSTEIDDLDSVRVFIPNTKVFSGDIINITNNGSLKVSVEVDVGYDTDLPLALSLLKEVAARQPDRISHREPVVGFTTFADSGITALVLIWVMPSNLMAARTALIIDIKAELDRHGIEIPFPHQVAVHKKA